MFIVSGTYIIEPGKRNEFMEAIYSQSIIEKIRNEDGNIAYEYFFPYEDENGVYFVERWESRPHWDAHCQAPHVVGELKALKDTYMTAFKPGLLGKIE